MRWFVRLQHMWWMVLSRQKEPGGMVPVTYLAADNGDHLTTDSGNNFIID